MRKSIFEEILDAVIVSSLLTFFILYFRVSLGDFRTNCFAISGMEKVMIDAIIKRE